MRDGGVVIRLGGNASGTIEATPGHRIVAGATAPDMRVARAAAEAGVAGLEFYRGIPGAIGGALRMNAGAYGAETKEALVEARGARRRTLSSPRRCSRAGPASLRKSSRRWSESPPRARRRS